MIVIDVKWTCKIWLAHDTAREARIHTTSCFKKEKKNEIQERFVVIKQLLTRIILANTLPLKFNYQGTQTV